RDEAVDAIKKYIVKSYGSKGQKIVDMNNAAVDGALENLFEVQVPGTVTSKIRMAPPVPEDAPEFIKTVTGEIIAGRGDDIPVSAFPADGTFPTGTTRFEKRNIAVDIPAWDPELCIQCGQCSFVCPHAAIRIKAYDPKYLDDAPGTLKSADAKTRNFAGMRFTVQVAPEDCTGCAVCVQNCPAVAKDAEGNKTDRKAINMEAQPPLREAEVENYDYFLSIPDTDPSLYKLGSIKGSQFVPAMFEYSGACAGCGETPYVKLLSQLFGDRALIGNATGCSSIYGGNLPTTPYTTRPDGRGPAWSNSLFEDNAEFAFGMRLTADKLGEFARELVAKLKDKGIATGICEEILAADQSEQAGIEQQRGRVARLAKEIVGRKDLPEAKSLLPITEYLVKRSIWALGGDGWAYDIGYGGLDHVLASGKNVNILVLDTEVYSNTGGQMSKATPLASTAKFAAGGKPVPKKDLGIMAMSYGTVYVACVAMGANPNQTVRAFMEAESYDGPSLIIAYSHCIAHGINMTTGLVNQKKAVACGHWINYRFDPRLKAQGKNPLQLDTKDTTIKFEDYAYGEIRYRSLKQKTPEHAAELMALAEKSVASRFWYYKQLAALDYSDQG
ncbi:MAG: 4Fe-4S double cluster binding domain-containing protein, partial [Gemmatimonadota bacterium]|nr:4Fe-4S double cluster binding domain-containing protein [Gemmatimonadota bacterium]